MGDWYFVADLRSFRGEIIKDKVVVARKIGMSVPTLDKHLEGGLLLLHKSYIVGKGEPIKSNRGGNQ